MNDSQQQPDALARVVHRTLLAGLVLSAVLLSIGLLITMLKGTPRVDLPSAHMPALLRLAATGNDVAVLFLGIFVLMLTPVVRVLVLAIGWSLHREKRMAMVALCVLTLLAISLLVGVG